MSDAVLEKILGRKLEAGGNADPDADAADDLGAFGWLRGVKERSVMLELRKRTGDILAVGYSWLEFVQFDPSEGITLWVPGRKIRITGRNLNAEVRPNVQLFHGLTRHRVPWAREADQNEIVKAASDATLIERIEG